MSGTGSTNDHTPWRNFNGVFLAVLLVCSLLSTSFLLYFNRVFASAVSSIIRTYVWHRYRIYIDIQALQVSLLGGRVFFTGLRYHGNNETILIQNGHITWAYWLWRVRDVDIGPKVDRKGKRSRDTENPANHCDNSKKLPCRINVAVSGLEWFIYNRSPVYDSMLTAMTDAAEEQVTTKPGDGTDQPTKPRQRLQKKLGDQLSKLESHFAHEKHKNYMSNEPTVEDGRSKPSLPTSDTDSAHAKLAHDLPLMLQVLPVHFECVKAAVVMGNENTKGILIIKSNSLDGEMDASESPNAPDPYRQVFNVRFDRPVVEIKDNVDYKEDQLTRAVKDNQTVLDAGPVQRRSFFKRQRRKLMGQLRDMVPYWRSSVESFSGNSKTGTTSVRNPIPGRNNWQGLSRYLNEDDQDDKIRWSTVEYAAVTTVVDSPEATLTIYWDVAGKVNRTQESQPSQDKDERSNVNGAESPAWAINLTIGGGTINYGPWADRLRADLQRVFNPSLPKDATPARALDTGDYRVATQFKLYVEIDQEVTLRIPTKEDSKNWRWKKEVTELRQHQKQQRRKGRGRARDKTTFSAAERRPYGWFDVKVGPNATVSYVMDTVAGAAGYSTTLNVDLPSTEVSTSVNHGMLWKSGRQRISSDLSAPLKWNALRKWTFDIDCDEMELFLLRDHIFLIIDLADDWATGPPPDYLLFTPFRYILNMQLCNFKLYLNVNDVNIVNNPTEFEENTYLILSSPCLKAYQDIPLDVYRPDKNAVPFTVQADLLNIAIHVPPWNTHAAFLTWKELGQVEYLALDGKYHYHSTTSPSNTDTLVLNVSGQSLALQLHGFVIHYLFLLKDNYFGDYVHFKTLEEYQEALRVSVEDAEAEAANRPPTKKSNDMDVIVNMRFDEPKVLLPACLYSAKRRITIGGASASVDLRFTNYYMDLELSLSPLRLSLDNEDDGSASPMSATTSTQMFIDGVAVHGHRLLGLPPTEPTYLCNWDITIGSVTGECSAEFLRALMGGAKAFGFLLDDDENALIPNGTAAVHDVTFLRLIVRSVQVWVHVEEAVFLVSTGEIGVKFNDWATTHYSTRADIHLPDLQLCCLDSESAARHKSRPNSRVETDALLRTSIDFALIGRKADFSRERRLQQELIRREDQRTHRTDFLQVPGVVGAMAAEVVDGPAQSVPSVPRPVTLDEGHDGEAAVSAQGTTTTVSRAGLRHKSSFLSESSNGSLLRRRRPKSSPHLPHGGHKGSSAEARRVAELAHERKQSSSTGHHSAFYSTAGEWREVSHTTVQFSSQYLAPYFPLDNVQPDAGEELPASIESDAAAASSDTSRFGLEDIDATRLSENALHSSYLVELPVGLSGFFNAASLRHVVSLMETLQPTDPEAILDDLHIGAVSDVLREQKQNKVGESITDLVMRIPQANLRFLHRCDQASTDPSRGDQDQYDLSFSQLALATRSDSRMQVDASTGLSSVHFRLASAEASAAERFAHMNVTQVAVMAKIEDVTLSLGSREVSYIDSDVGTFRVTTSSGQVEYLAGLIDRTKVLASELDRVLASSLRRGDDRVKHFVSRLVTEGDGTGDPAFMVRPSAVLRSASEHLRSKDSWKLMARLRQVLRTRDEETRGKLRLECMGDDRTWAADARQQVTKSLLKWRGWDLEDLDQAVLMDRIFGKLAQQPPGPTHRIPLMAVWRVQEMEFVLDPGPKQNQVIVVDSTLRLQRQATGGSELESALITVTLYCAQAGLSLDWELLELVDDVVRMYRRMDRPEGEPSVATQAAVKVVEAAEEAPLSIHLVVALDRALFSLETVNLRVDHGSDEVNLSVMFTRDAGGATESNVILACDTVTTKVRSHEQALATWRLWSASVFLAHKLQMEAEMSRHVMTATASSHDMKLLIKQDPLVLSDVVDMLVKDEVAQLYHLQKELSHPAVEGEAAVQRQDVWETNIAIFLNTYTISLPIVRSLTYTVSGMVARVAMEARFGKEMVFDFDIKENRHEMQIRVNNTTRSISVLQIPPTNGQVRSRKGQGEHCFVVFASVELIQLDASAVYSLLAALNRPETSNAAKDLQQQVTTIQAHVAEIFGPPAQAESKAAQAAGDRFVYVIHTTLAGLEMYGQAPITADSSPLAQLLFSLDKVHFELANRMAQEGSVLENAEIHINLRRITVDIGKGSRVEAMTSCGNMSFGAAMTATTKEAEDGTELRSFDFVSDGFEVNLSPDTVSTVVDVLGYMGDKIKDLDNGRELEYLQKRLRQSRPRTTQKTKDEEGTEASDILDSFLSSVMYSFEIRNFQANWLVVSGLADVDGQEDLVFSFERIELGTKKKKAARLTIEKLQLQMLPRGQDRKERSANSALLPEAVFNVAFVSSKNARRLAFQAVGKSLDLRLTSDHIVPASNITDSISLSINKAQEAAKHWTPMPSEEKAPSAAERPGSIFGGKRLESVLIDADFAGAVVHLSSRGEVGGSGRTRRPSMAGKYGQFSESGSMTVLRTPGLAWKTEYRDDGKEDPAFYGEIKVDASRNILFPGVVPLVMDITSGIKQVVSKNESKPAAGMPASEPTDHRPGPGGAGEDDSILTADPSVVLGRTKLNIGLRICRQEFTLSCQPIGRVAATASFEDVYVTVNTVRSLDHGNFFAISGAFTKLSMSVQHVYSRESTGSFKVESMVLSLMNSKHVSGTNGLSAILNVSPMKVDVKAKQLQDFLLFREIWLPRGLRQASTAPVADKGPVEPQGHLVQRYQQVAATAAFPWTATISIGAMDVTVDLGQALGKSEFTITDFWVASKKTSDWEQNLCLGFQQISIDSTGRLSGSVTLQDFKLRTSIQWPERRAALTATPRVQASIGFSQFRLKAGFDYQLFVVADITSVEFLMYNVRQGRADRLVAVLEGDSVQVFGTTNSAAQAVSLWQALQRLNQERRARYECSMRDIEKLMKRNSTSSQVPVPALGGGQAEQAEQAEHADKAKSKSPISLDTDVVVTLKAVNLGIFPNTFSDYQVFKMEALNGQARFAASVGEQSRVQSIVGLTLGQLRIGLASVRQDSTAGKSGTETSIEDVVATATGSRGGTILKVPKVEARMQTWQSADSRAIDYIFKSAFEGKVEVGWNYSRVSFMRGMWASHSKALAQTSGGDMAGAATRKATIKVTGVPGEEEDAVAAREKDNKGGKKTKITAEVNVPLSRYEYRALEPAVIETPQLRDMGEATPPLEWIGLQRERLPHLTHQIVIVSLLELAGEVEAAYERILGSS